MRIALLSGIHGNLTALDAVLAELAQEAIDQCLCLGDVMEHGPQPRATFLCIDGNIGYVKHLAA